MTGGSEGSAQCCDADGLMRGHGHPSGLALGGRSDGAASSGCRSGVTGRAASGEAQSLDGKQSRGGGEVTPRRGGSDRAVCVAEGLAREQKRKRRRVRGTAGRGVGEAVEGGGGG